VTVASINLKCTSYLCSGYSKLATTFLVGMRDIVTKDAFK
jgi:hypothetical protein